METKTCNRCKRSFGVENFSKNSRKNDGLQASCKICMKEFNAKHYQKKYKSIQMEKNRFRRSVLKQKIVEVKQNNPCLCGENDPVCLDFHHLGDKDITIAKMLADTFSWQLVKEEMSKCCVLCANCHRKLHANSFLTFDKNDIKAIVV